MMLPKITELEFELEEVITELQPIGVSFLYNFDTGQFAYSDGRLVELTGIESLKMWILKIMKTQKFKFEVYKDTIYGVLIDDLISSNMPRAYIESEIEREVTESLLLSPYIDGLEGWSFERDGKLMKVFFRVVSPMYNTFEMEVRFSV